jgi:hypothetical protein
MKSASGKAQAYARQSKRPEANNGWEKPGWMNAYEGSAYLFLQTHMLRMVLIILFKDQWEGVWLTGGGGGPRAAILGNKYMENPSRG